MNNENSNLVSVIIPTYNCANTIINTLRAIDLQVTNYQIEVIVSDDCSTDNTLETINNYNYKNVLLKIIRNNENVGLPKHEIKLLMQLLDVTLCSVMLMIYGIRKNL